jgi:two-component system, OmpR family, phosphate regulon sensor histidine kinase PhoR
MGSSLRKVSLLIISIIVLPVLIFSIFEIGNLRQSEKVIQDIYRNQLDAILFSINQFSDDRMSSLAVRVENNEGSISPDSHADLTGIITEIPSIKGLLQFDNNLNLILSVPDSCCDAVTFKEITTMLEQNTKVIKQLKAYFKEGYRKINPIVNPGGNLQWIMFVTRSNEKEVTNLLIIDPEKFISQVLDPKIQEIARGKFDIAAYRPGEDLPFYTSNKKFVARKISDREPFWLLPDFLMGIELKDITIADLTRDRVKRNLIIVGLMDLILLFGAWLIFRNVRKQVELSQLKSDFVSSVSHEIRTPLALIKIYIETLEMGRLKDEKKVKEYYNVILNETIRLSGIVNRILSFSQIESNKRKYSFTDSDLNEIVENASLSYRYSLENKGFKYSLLTEEDLPVIRADKDALIDAIVNLVDNAIKYSTDIKDIVVRTGKAEKYVFVEVEDKGIGISEKNQKYIFDKFYRVSEMNIANKVKGSGLGLAIVKHIMDAHDGKITVRSTPGEGSLFRLSFPVK